MAQPRTIALGLALITLLVYLPAGQYGFIVFDDPDYVYENRLVVAGLTWEGIRWAVTSFEANNWHPVTWLSHMLDCQLFGLNAGAHHLVNVIHHTVNAVILFFFIHRLSGRIWAAAMIAALFAWHPLRVESVAWISERKDVLSGGFALLALWQYQRYQQAGRRRSFWVAWLFFVLGIMAKPMVVTLPFVLLLLDWYQQQKNGNTGKSVWSQIIEKWPFFLISALACLLTVQAQRGEAIGSLATYPMELRLKNAVVASAGYLGKTVWPTELAVIYPFPKTIPWSKVLLATVILAAITTVVWRERRTKPCVPAGWFWFLGMLVPVIGIVQVGGQAMADRYTYLPQIGILWAVVVAVAEWMEGKKFSKKIQALTGVAPLVIALGLTSRQLPYWQDSEKLFQRAVEVTRENPVARINLGVALEQKGKPEAARREYEEALRLEPNRVQVHNNLGNLLDGAGETEAALNHYQVALQLRPDHAVTHQNIAVTLSKIGRFTEAQEHLNEAARLQPASPWPEYLMGKLLLREGRSQEAVEKFLAALRKESGNLPSLVWLARTKAADLNPSVRNGTAAVAAADQANQLTAGQDAFVLDTLAMAYAEAGRWKEAQETIAQALEQTPQTETNQLQKLSDRKKQYEAGRPYREDFTGANQQPPNPF